MTCKNAAHDGDRVRTLVDSEKLWEASGVKGD